MLFTKLKEFIPAVVLSNLALISFAQNKLDSLQHLKEVIVVAKPFQEVIPSQKLSGIQLERMNSHSVADALRYFAGVQIKDYGGIGGLKTVNIRSLGSQHVGVFYDGIQLGNAQNGITDLGKYSLDDMEEISLYNGQKSEIFQSAKDFSSASTIYLKSRRPQFKEDQTYHIKLRYKAASINLYNPSLRWDQKFNNRLSFSLSSEYQKTDGRYKFYMKRVFPDGSLASDTTATRQDGDVETLRIETALYGIINNGLWDVKVYSYLSERGIPGAIVNRSGNEFTFENGQRLKDKNVFAQGSILKDVSDKYKTQLKVKWAYDYTHYVDTLLSSINIQNTYIQQELYASWINKYSILPIWDISLSADYQWNKLNADLVNFSYPIRQTTLVAAATSLNLGKFKAQGSLLGTFVHEQVKMNSKAPDKSEYTPAIFAGYKPFDRHDFNLRAFYKRIFRMPTLNDLYYTMIGNTSLKPEYTIQYNLGFSYNKIFNNKTFNSFSFQADAYYNTVRDKIIAAPGAGGNGGQFRWMMFNLGYVKIRGVDVSTSLSSSIENVNLTATATYTYQKAQDYTDKTEEYYKDQIPYTPWHSASALLSANYKTWDLNYSFIYTGKRYDVNQNNIPVNEVQPWYTHDVSLQKEFTYKKYRFRGSVEMNNIFNQFYEVVLNYPMPGRNFKFILSIDL